MLTCCRCDKCQSERGRGFLTGPGEALQRSEAVMKAHGQGEGLSSRIVKPQEGNASSRLRARVMSQPRPRGEVSKSRAGRSPAVRRGGGPCQSEGGRVPQVREVVTVSHEGGIS